MVGFFPGLLLGKQAGREWVPGEVTKTQNPFGGTSRRLRVVSQWNVSARMMQCTDDVLLSYPVVEAVGGG